MNEFTLRYFDHVRYVSITHTQKREKEKDGFFGGGGGGISIRGKGKRQKISDMSADFDQFSTMLKQLRSELTRSELEILLLLKKLKRSRKDHKVAFFFLLFFLSIF